MSGINLVTAATKDAVPMPTTRTYRGPFAVMTILFFMWGFITVLNDILIPKLQDAFALTNYKIMFIR